MSDKDDYNDPDPDHFETEHRLPAELRSSNQFLPDDPDEQIELPNDPAEIIQCLEDDCGKQVKQYDPADRCPFCGSRAVIIESPSPKED